MAQWGTSTSNESKPNWLTDEQKERTYATEAGWTIKQKGGVEEVLVAVRGLGTRLSAASITEVTSPILAKPKGQSLVRASEV